MTEGDVGGKRSWVGGTDNVGSSACTYHASQRFSLYRSIPYPGSGLEQVDGSKYEDAVCLV